MGDASGPALVNRAHSDGLHRARVLGKTHKDAGHAELVSGTHSGQEGRLVFLPWILGTAADLCHPGKVVQALITGMAGLSQSPHVPYGTAAHSSG